MSVGRRRTLLPLAFLGLAVAWTGVGTARAQQRSQPPHDLWNSHLTPDQIKAALDKIGIGGDGENDPLRKMVRDSLLKQHPEIPPQLLDAALQKAFTDPNFLEKARQYAKERQTAPGRMPNLTPEDVEKFTKIVPNADPRKAPTIETPREPRIDKGNAGRPPVGQPPFPNRVPPEPDPAKVDPLPKIDAPPKVETLPQPVPNPMFPMDPGTPMPSAPRSVTEDLFRPPDEPTDPRAKSLQAFAAVWERNVGPLDQTPEVKRALFDLVSDTNGLDLDLKDDKGNSLWDLMRKGEGDGLSLDNFMEGGGGNWKLPQFDFPSFKMGKWWGGGSSGGNPPSSSGSSWFSGGSPRPRGPSGGGSGGGFGNFGFGGSYFPLVVLGLVVLGILAWVLVKHLREGELEPALAADGLGAWPIDPRRINTREDVVKAFEYLSVLICGPSAKAWTHNTIADALRELATTHGDTAVSLARLYELARYAPLDEPLSRTELMEARELVCGLAGVSY